LDEVTKSIDANSRKSINEVIKSLKKEKTIIIITHNIDEVEQDSNIIYLWREKYQKDLKYHPIDISMQKAAFS
jgi:ATP-binding cassette subfamily B protein/subfamily B ATP-binding cassette protein MsbA